MSEEDQSFSPVYNKGSTDFQDTIEKLLKSYMKENTKISRSGVIVAAEFLRLFVVGMKVQAFLCIEAIQRAHKEAENADVVTARDIQKILPELLLDFQCTITSLFVQYFKKNHNQFQMKSKMPFPESCDFRDYVTGVVGQ